MAQKSELSNSKLQAVERAIGTEYSWIRNRANPFLSLLDAPDYLDRFYKLSTRGPNIGRITNHKCHNSKNRMDSLLELFNHEDFIINFPYYILPWARDNCLPVCFIRSAVGCIISCYLLPLLDESKLLVNLKDAIDEGSIIFRTDSGYLDSYIVFVESDLGINFTKAAPCSLISSYTNNVSGVAQNLTNIILCRKEDINLYINNRVDELLKEKESLYKNPSSIKAQILNTAYFLQGNLGARSVNHTVKTADHLRTFGEIHYHTNSWCKYDDKDFGEEADIYKISTASTTFLQMDLPLMRRAVREMAIPTGLFSLGREP